VLDRAAALAERLRLWARARAGVFLHLPGLGRTIEPKRNHSPQSLAREAENMRRGILSDPDVLSVKITMSRPFAGVLEARFSVVSKFDPNPISFSESFNVAGGQ
jgi:hypothetical protein